MIADRLVNELMLVSVLVAGERAAAFAEKLEAAGAVAEILGHGPPPDGFDLTILFAAPGAVGDADMSARVAALSGASNRLLFAPLPLRDDPGATGSPTAAALNDWFELFAEHGYQPVVDFDADFVAAGAFLVDREATAAESELAAFADRLQSPAAAQPLQPAPQDDSVGKAEFEALRAEIASLQAQITSLRDAAGMAAHQPEAPAAQESGWEALLPWVSGIVADTARNTAESLRHDLPRLLELRGAAAPPPGLSEMLLVEPTAPRRSWLARLFRPAASAPPPPDPAILADIALVRASKLFDAAWYIATTPELLAGEPLDPVCHYVLVGSLRGADPGPWFNTASYLEAHPQAAEDGACPLVHALRSGEAERMLEHFPT